MEKVELNLQQWAMDNIPKDEMIYKEGFWNAIIFWRDTIIPMFLWDKKYSNTYGDEFYEGYAKMNEHHKIVGTHFSKSIKHPVLYLEYKGCIVVWRYNFYDYEIAVISDKKIRLNSIGFFNTEKESCFYQGYPEEYQLEEFYNENKKSFMVCLEGHYQFYAFMCLLKQALDIR